MTGHVDETARAIREQFKSGDFRLPVLPAAVLQVQKMANDDSHGAADIAGVLEQEPSMAATIIRLANSAQFNPTGKEIRNLPFAVQRLGPRKAAQLLFALGSQMIVPVASSGLQSLLAHVNEYSIRTAVAARHLAHLIKACDPDDAFLAGMLHCIGIPALIHAAGKEIVALPEDIRQATIEQLYRETGARLLVFWEVPHSLVNVASYHGIEADDRPKDKIIDFVDAGAFIVQQLGFPAPFCNDDSNIDMASFPPIQRIGATDTHIAAVEIELEDAFQEIATALRGG
ncbi:MAG: HDOD domain-containing protein [Mariprofundaceae bacterium]